MLRRNTISVFFIILMTVFSADAQTTPSDVSDLVGARASSGETELTNRGYKFVKTQKGDDRNWSNWWNSKSKTCLTIVTLNGRYDSIISGPKEDCSETDSGENNQTNYGQTPSDVSDLVGARAAGGETELQKRGYSFVKTQKGDDRSWSNWWNSKSKVCLSVVTFDGRYDSIVSSPPPDCNQSGEIDVSDLVDARAAGGETELQKRGFRLVDSSKGKTSSNTYWFNDETRQCILVTTSTGRYSKITPTTNKKCQ